MRQKARSSPPESAILWKGARVEETVESLMSEIRGRLQDIESSLPRNLDILAVSPTPKLPFKALSYRATLIWRMAELSRDAYHAFEADRLASAILLTRAAVETCAALWYLTGKVSSALKSGSVGDIDSYLMRLFGGSRVDGNMPQAINVLNFVDCVEKDLEGFRHQYDLLSEFAHPNWSGTTGLYSKIDQANFAVEYGSNVRELAGPKHIGVINLSVALGLFENSYNRLGDDFPKFIQLCNRAVDAAESAPSNPTDGDRKPHN